jgi:chaperonin cofactor prefoldin
MNLYELTTEAKMIASLLETEELTSELESMLVINQQELSDKSMNYAKVIRNLESDSDAIDHEIKRLKGMKEAKDRAIDRMKEAVRQAMLSAGIDKIESNLFKLSLRRSEAVEVISIDQLPESLVTVKKTISADKVKIKETIKNGVPVEGAVIVENYSLQIK